MLQKSTNELLDRDPHRTIASTATRYRELEFESWEDHYDLHERRDYASLDTLCESEVRRRPDDLHAAERLADAYMLNKQYDKAVEFTTKIHREFPDIPSFQHRILDPLRALGRNEDDFKWTVRPKIIRLTSDFVHASAFG